VLILQCSQAHTGQTVLGAFLVFCFKHQFLAIYEFGRNLNKSLLKMSAFVSILETMADYDD